MRITERLIARMETTPDDTRPGVYALVFDNGAKVGTAADIRRRLRDYRKDWCRRPREALAYLCVDKSDRYSLERAIINALKRAGFRNSGEFFFRAGSSDVRNAISVAMSRCPIVNPFEKTPEGDGIPEPIPEVCTAYGADCSCEGDPDADFCPECDCDCESCELQAFDYDLWEAHYVLGTKKFPTPLELTDEDLEDLRAAVESLCRPTPSMTLEAQS